MFDDLNKYKPDKSLTTFYTQWWFWLLIILMTSLVGAWIFGWLAVPLRIFSQQNVEAQWTWGYDQYESLQAVSQQVCSAEKAIASAQSDTERTQRQTQMLAYEMNYSRLAADYDARMRNAFQAGLVRPSDLPQRAPSLEDMKLNTCAV